MYFSSWCIFHHIDLTKELVRAAVQSRAGNFPNLSREAQTVALERFWDIRAIDKIRKQPSTAEVLVWLSILSARNITVNEIKTSKLSDLPGLTVLLKDADDIKTLKDQE